MDTKKLNNPAVIVLMVIAIIGFLGFAIKQAMVPDKPPAPAAATAPPAVAPPPAETASSRTVISPDAAPEVDPFRPLPVKRTADSQQASAAQRQPVLPAPPPSPGTVPTPLLVAQDRERRAAALQGSTADRPLPTLGGASAQPMPVVVEPTLAGTLLGSRPMAVFKNENSTVMVPQGGAYLGWRVLRVGHGEATVWNGTITVQLRVGTPTGTASKTAALSTAPTTSSRMTPGMPAGYAEANCIVVHYGARPGLSRRELVMGRREELLQVMPRREDEAQPSVEDDRQPVASPPSEPQVQGDGQ